MESNSNQNSDFTASDSENKVTKTKLGLSIIIPSSIFVILFLLFLFIPAPKITSGFENIDDIKRDAAQKEETAQPEDYKDHRRPSWKTYHTRCKKSFLKRKVDNFLMFFGLKSKPTWSPEYFKKLLEKQIKEREEKKYLAEHVCRVVPSDKARFIVWGDLTGAYHSVVRALEKLISLGVMDKNLKLVSPDDYIVFMGDAAARSPFIMELLTLMMKLMEQNGDKVFYITGNNERRGAWYTYGLREEIQMKAGHLTTEKKPLYKVAERFFETLPLGIYVSVPPHDSTDFVRFSHFSMEVPSKETYREFVELLDDSYFSEKLLENRKQGEGRVIKLEKDRNEPDSELVTVRATIKSYRKLKEYQKNAGLRLLDPDKSATAWTILSSPTVFAQHLIKFFEDAFVILQLAPKIRNWTITLYNRDMRTDEAFSSIEYNFISGKLTSEEVKRDKQKKAVVKSKPKKEVEISKKSENVKKVKKASKKKIKSKKKGARKRRKIKR